MTTIRAYRSPGHELRFKLHAAVSPALEIVRHAARAFAALAPIYRPALVRANLDSFVEDELGLAEDGCQVQPIAGILVARKLAGASDDLRHPHGPVVDCESLTPEAIGSWLADLVSGATSTGVGRPGLSMIETPVGSARLPAWFTLGRPSIELVDEYAHPHLVAPDPDGWVAGPSADGVVPVPLRVHLYRQEWELTIDISILWDTFRPPNAPVLPELRRCFDDLVALGWVEG